MLHLSRASIGLLTFFVALGLLYLQTTLAAWLPQEIERVSVSSTGEQANGESYSSASFVSDDGRLAFFSSTASNFVLTDTNKASDVFVHDRFTGETRLISRLADGSPPPESLFSNAEAISADGTDFLFTQSGSGLIPTDTNGTSDVFIWHEPTDTMELISRASNGTPAGNSRRADMTRDGDFIVYASTADTIVPKDTDTFSDLFLVNRTTQQTTLVSLNEQGEKGNGDTYDVEISQDGTFIVFASLATNFLASDVNDVGDIFYRHLISGDIRLLSRSIYGGVADDESFAPHLSANGRYVVFASYAEDLIPNDTNRSLDIFVYDLEMSTIERVSVASDGTQGDYDSLSLSSISGDGRFVLFTSRATNLVPNDTGDGADVFLHDRLTGETTLLSVSNTGVQGNDGSFNGNISIDGRYAILTSVATNLVPNDTNGVGDIFVIDRFAVEATPTPTPSAIPTSTSTATPTRTPTATSTPTPPPMLYLPLVKTE